MANLFIMYALLIILSLVCYKQEKLGLILGFGGCAIASFFGAISFLINLQTTWEFSLFGNFLFTSKFGGGVLENFFCFLISFIGFLGAIFSFGYVTHFKEKANLSVFAALYNGFLLSMLLVVVSKNIWSFVVLWEIMTLVSALFIYINDFLKENLKTIMIYIGIAQVGAFCMILGFMVLGALSDNFSFEIIANSNFSDSVSLVVFILFLVGFGSKAGIWPFHVWLSMAHPMVPSNISALMSGIMLKVAIFAFIKFSLLLNITTTMAYITILAGSISAVLGILYGVIDNDYKKAIAYSSIENIGIIFIAIGVGFYGIAKGNEIITIMGFLAALFHTLNHAVFKSLLFFATGLILSFTDSRDMNKFGGLHKKMPFTSFAFLIGAISVCALPPLNGFMSEWVLFQSIIQSASEIGFTSRLMMVLALLSIGVAGTLAVMSFVKIYSSIFLGQPRDIEIYEKANEKSKSMLFSVVVLAILCILIGIFSKFVIDGILIVVNSMFNTLNSLENINFVSNSLILIILMTTGILAFVLLVIFRANFASARITQPWACGFKYSPNMQISSSPFTGDLRKLFRFFYKTENKLYQDGYFGETKFESKTTEICLAKFYEPLIEKTAKFADFIGFIQNGKTNIYALYILVYLCVMFAFSYYIF